MCASKHVAEQLRLAIDILQAEPDVGRVLKRFPRHRDIAAAAAAAAEAAVVAAATTIYKHSGPGEVAAGEGEQQEWGKRSQAEHMLQLLRLELQQQ